MVFPFILFIILLRSFVQSIFCVFLLPSVWASCRFFTLSQTQRKACTILVFIFLLNNSIILYNVSEEPHTPLPSPSDSRWRFFFADIGLYYLSVSKWNEKFYYSFSFPVPTHFLLPPPHQYIPIHRSYIYHKHHNCEQEKKQIKYNRLFCLFEH